MSDHEENEDSAPRRPAAKKVDVVAAARELAEFFKSEPEGIEKPLVQAGDQLLAFYEDGNFRDTFQNLRQLKAEAIEMAIQDVASGVMTLRSSTIGVTFKGRGLTPFVSPHGSSPSGTVVFSINWKNIKAFHNWRNGEGDDVSQDEINAAIYRLALFLSKMN